MFKKVWVAILLVCLILPKLTSQPQAAPSSTTYYVSSSSGNDSYNGLSQGTPFQTIAMVNTLSLGPGDQVLFKCGDTWRAEMLVITRSGAAGSPIVFGSYPEACSNKPVISGSQPISGWSPYSGSIYAADLSAGANAGLFPNGINQLFRDGERLRLGRWPNWTPNGGGYATIDGQPASDRIIDNQLPGLDWTGAVAHIKGMRWYILNREVTGANGTFLHLGAGANCWGGCEGWGYFLNNHLGTLDQDGEWFYNASTDKVYLFSSSGAPNNIEGSVILDGEGDYLGGIILGRHLWEHISYVTIQNFAVVNWFESGITTPTNLETDDNANLIIRDNLIRNVDSTGIRLATWVWNAANGVDGWRGGHNLEVINNVIDGANHFGIDSYAYASTFQDNVIKNIGLIENVGRSGIGCGYTGDNCTENGDGIRIKLDQAAFSAHHNNIQYNQLDKTGYCGMDIFGSNNTIAYNLIENACFSKGDCGGLRSFGRDSLSSTEVYNLTIRNNIILNTIGNTDGAHSTYADQFGLGLYIDNYSKDVEISGNTVISSTATGVLYQRSTGVMQGNNLYNNSYGTMYSGQVGLFGSQTLVSEMRSNVLYGLNERARTLSADSKNKLGTSDQNYLFNPYHERHISAEGWKTLAEWKSYSGKDASSKDSWFSLTEGDPPRSQIFYNDSKSVRVIDLQGVRYYDLDQHLVSGSLTLQPFTSKVLVKIYEPVLYPGGLYFASYPPGTQSSPLPVTLTNSGLALLQINSVTASGEFIQSNDCPAGLVVDASCTIQVTFSPVSDGAKFGVLTLDTSGGQLNIELRGVGGAMNGYLPLVVNLP